MDKLKPCPFCGTVVWGNDEESLTKKQEIKLWNTRTQNDFKE